MNKETLNRIKKLSVFKDSKSVVATALKLTEEVGEVAEAVLSSENIIGSKHKNLNQIHVMHEIVDVLIVCIDLSYKIGIQYEELDTLINLKLDKWEQILNNEIQQS